MNGKYVRVAESIQKMLADARAGRCPMGYNVTLPSPELLDIACHYDFGWVQVNQEHTMLAGPQSIATMLRASYPLDVPVLVKPNASEPLLIRDAMDAGAHGVLLPFMNSADQLREIQATCKFPPEGRRGFCGLARAMNYFAEAGGSPPERANYMEFINDHFLFVPIIETLEAADNIDEMLEVPGFDVFHVGMGDLFMSVAEEGEGMDYTLRLAKMLCKKIHDAGKVVMGDIDITEPLEGGVNFIEAYNLHLPYVTDTTLMAYAFGRTMEVRDGARPGLAELLNVRDAALAAKSDS